MRGLWSVCLVTLVVSAANAQQTQPASVRGVVKGEFGTPIADARIQVADLKRRATSDSSGRFDLRALPAGDSLHVIVARLGYRPVHLVWILREGENVREVVLEPIAQQLDAVRTETEQTGLFGVVGDTAYDVVADARVTLTAGQTRERQTNELGQFAFDEVRPGGNFLEVRKVGYRPRLVSFTHPARGGTKLVVWLTPWFPGAPGSWSEFPNRTTQALYDFRARTRYRSSGAVIVTRDVLAKYGIGMRLSDAIESMPGSLIKGLRARDFTKIIVDDVDAPESTWALSDFDADNVEMVELYPPGTDVATSIRTGTSMRRTRSMTSLSGSGTMSTTSGFVARVWLRR